jgi:hypothetical protein
MTWLLPVAALVCVLAVILLNAAWNFAKDFCKAIGDRIARSL